MSKGSRLSLLWHDDQRETHSFIPHFIGLTLDVVDVIGRGIS